MLTVRIALLFLLVPVIYGTWLYHVNTLVPDPYLDEVFHIPQAQAYCDGHFQTWDPKITTPPGLYLVSYVVVQIRRLISSGDVCSVADLRLLNAAITLFILPFQVWDLHRCLFPEGARNSGQDSATLFHSVSNICLFPLLFFFSGLYYTDVCSVSFVLAAYQYHIRSLCDGATSGWMNAVMVFIVGIGALLMRQTNIFWVAVFPGGLHAVNQVKSQGRWEADGSKASPDIPTAVYDPPIREAYLEDYIKTTFSLAVSAVSDPIPLLLSLWPYLALLAFFALFILRNGGVVLGDKENHIASVHTPQMLYLWPYITFFSWPLILPHLLHLVCSKSTFFTSTTTTLRNALPRPIVAIPIMAAMTLSVHFNTIIHPFTLADNRHYIFYVFRLLLLKHPLIKYAVVPIYFLCAWGAILALGHHPHPHSNSHSANATEPPKEETKTKTTTTVGRLPKKARPEVPEEPPRLREPLRASFLLIFLTVTTLSLITAPLVEPRYFILPWLVWRLHVRPPSSPSSTTQPTHPTRSRSSTPPPPSPLSHLLQLPNEPTRLSLETAWFLLVNVATGWIFLYWGFEWVGEGEREMGRVQRFMW